MTRITRRLPSDLECVNVPQKERETDSGLQSSMQTADKCLTVEIKIKCNDVSHSPFLSENSIKNRVGRFSLMQLYKRGKEGVCEWGQFEGAIHLLYLASTFLCCVVFLCSRFFLLLIQYCLPHISVTPLIEREYCMFGFNK
jgi:hypothetical protein